MTKSVDFIDKLRKSGLRPTRQRLKICEVLFDRDTTFHFTINDLTKIISEKLNEKISLATVYNTVHAFKNKGYLKEISINSDKSYFDTNTSVHHHFFDEDTNRLIDCDENDLDEIKIKKNITGKKISSVEVLIKVASDYQNQK
ncbi:Fur family transcriptional regulator [Candidatus Pelagibacter sp.]|jgi:Fur family iron response transcriptional regulator|uniref:Fur family transcriptional regulator n=1 Tax=Candidatus Pelagibacter sp. TaxID=2024849 RepID=UPI003F83D824|tara:strand:- start:16 stop:444 length:429 start_codon:yes stop_codon:yes gene_type:complete